MQQKTCKQCGQHKPLTDYYLARGTPRERCKACVIENGKARYRADPERTKASVVAARLADPRARMAADARARDRRKGLPSDIEAGHIVIPERCPVLGIPMETQAGRAVDGSPSIDHLDPTQGAVWGNWRVISHRANQLKARHSARSLAAHIAALEAGTKAVRGRVTLDEYRAVLWYLDETRRFIGLDNSPPNDGFAEFPYAAQEEVPQPRHCEQRSKPDTSQSQPSTM